MRVHDCVNTCCCINYPRDCHIAWDFFEVKYIYVSTFQFLSYYTWDCARYWYYNYNLPLLIYYVSLIGLSFLWVSYIWLLSWCLTCTLINMASDLSFREPETFLSQAQSYTFLCSMLFFSSQLPLVKNPPHLAGQLVSSVSS